MKIMEKIQSIRGRKDILSFLPLIDFLKSEIPV
jgi:hypothetical protein